MVGILMCLVVICIMKEAELSSLNRWLTPSLSQIAPPGTNLYVDMMERIAGTFNLTNCWACGGLQEAREQWPWRAFPLAPKWLVSDKADVKSTGQEWDENRSWDLSQVALGEYCISSNGTGRSLGHSQCTWTLKWAQICTKYADQWNSAVSIPISPQMQQTKKTRIVPFDSNPTRCQAYEKARGERFTYVYSWKWVHPNGTVAKFNTYWSALNDTNEITKCEYRDKDGVWKCQFKRSNYYTDPLGQTGNKYYPLLFHSRDPLALGGENRALKGHYWICGRKAYTVLPRGWTGTCYVGVIVPSFFLLPSEVGNKLGVSLYDDWKRAKRSIDVSLTQGGSQKWKEDEWPPQRIIEYYGPATWANDGSWGYRTPIYMLNRIIRLQAVLEVITNQTATALELLARQSSQMREAIYQNRMALDYLLAEDGGVCGKFNLSNCCLQIDDNGKAVLEIAKEIRKIAHVPIQTWEPTWSKDWWFQLFGGPWWKKVGFVLLCALTGLIFIPCLIPCLTRLITTTVEGMQVAAVPLKAQTVAKVMVLRKIPRNYLDMPK